MHRGLGVKSRLAILIFLCGLGLAAQANRGGVHLWVTDAAGQAIQVRVQIASEANQYHSDFETDNRGELDVRQLPYGAYTVEIQKEGFSPYSETLAIRTSLPTRLRIQLRLAAVNQSLTVEAAPTLIDPEQPGSVNQIGSERIAHRLSSIPGRSL